MNPPVGTSQTLRIQITPCGHLSGLSAQALDQNHRPTPNRVERLIIKVKLLKSVTL